MPNETVWSDDVEVELHTGDRVRGILDVTVVLPDGTARTYDNWRRGVKTAELTGLWNARLAGQGYTGRMRVESFWGFGPQQGFREQHGKNFRTEFEVIAVVEENPLPLLAIAVVALFAAVIADAAINDGRVINCTGRAIGTFASNVLEGVIKPVTTGARSVLIPVLGIAATVVFALVIFR